MGCKKKSDYKMHCRSVQASRKKQRISVLWILSLWVLTKPTLRWISAQTVCRLKNSLSIKARCTSARDLFTFETPVSVVEPALSGRFLSGHLLENAVKKFFAFPQPS